MQLSPMAHKDVQSPILTAVALPEPLNVMQLINQMRAQHKIAIVAGLGPHSRTHVRFGHHGRSSDCFAIERVLSAFSDVLNDMGYSNDRASILSAASEEYALQPEVNVKVSPDRGGPASDMDVAA